jgi:DNA-binding NarL/FixJ family response regulator
MSPEAPFQSPDVRPIRVLLVCRERVIRAALAALIDRQAGLTVIGEADGLDAACAAIVSERPDVTLLDPDRYLTEGAIADLLRAAEGHTRTILLTGSPDSPGVAEALEGGAAGVVLKQQDPEILLKAIDKVHAGELWLDRRATARMLTGLAGTDGRERSDDDRAADADRQRAASLTRREREVAALVGEGLRNTQIAERLRISEITVRNHLTSTFRKLRLTSRFQLVIYAFQHGLAELPSPGGRAAQAELSARLAVGGKRP